MDDMFLEYSANDHGVTVAVGATEMGHQLPVG